MKSFYITTAIDYTNGVPHIGHTYEKVLADVIARYQRLRNQQREVFFLTGVDQHGQKVQQAAEREGVSPQQFVDKITTSFTALWEQLGISYDGWAATTDPEHQAVVQQLLTHLQQEDWLYKASYKGYYSVRQEQFLTDKERQEDGSFGPEWGEVIFLEEQNWYFRLSRCKEWLLKLLSERTDLILPAFRQKELFHAVEKIEGDLCVSRPKSRLSWGIEFPFDPDFVTYVWFDALLNYLTFAGYLDPERHADFEQRWPCDAHVIGKDILIPAHGVYWLAMLHAIGFCDEQMPHLLVHGFWSLRGDKISKSTGNVVDPQELLDQFGKTALRYYLMRDAVVGQDADFHEERLLSRYHTELANGFGNLLQRTLSMVQRYRGGVLVGLTYQEQDRLYFQELLEYQRAYLEKMDRYQIHAALEDIVEMTRKANGFAEKMAPWKLAKEESEEASRRLDVVLALLLQSIQLIASLLEPIIPHPIAKIWEQLQLPALPLQALSLEKHATLLLQPEYHVGKPTPLFPRLEIEPSLNS